MAHPVDIHVGQKLRQRRWAKGMTQQQLGDRVGIRFQQIQKYETGTNRVSASRLWQIARAMDVPVSYFFDGLAGGVDEASPLPGDVLADREALELIRIYYAIPENQRRQLFELARVLSGNPA